MKDTERGRAAEALTQEQLWGWYEKLSCSSDIPDSNSSIPTARSEYTC